MRPARHDARVRRLRSSIGGTGVKCRRATRSSPAPPPEAGASYRAAGEPSLAFTPWDSLDVDPASLATAIPGVFAGGDSVLGPSTVVESMRQGRRAAEAIHKHLRDEPLRDFA